MNHIKKIFSLIILGLLINACGGGGNNISKEEELKLLRNQLKEIQKKVRTLEIELDSKKVEQSYPVSVATIEKSDFVSYLEIPGTITSKQNVLVFAEMPGNITNIAVSEGDYVNSGKLIAQQDASAIDAQIRQMEAGLALAKTTFARQERLWNQKIGSEIQYLQAKTNVESLEAQLASLKAQAAKFAIYSPINGIVDEIYVNRGESPTGPVARIINIGNVQMEAQLSENYVGKIRKGDQVTILVPNLGITKQARVSSVGQVIDPKSRTFRIEVSLNNRDRLLKPNMTASMKLIIDQIKDTITIPLSIIQKNDDRDYVFIADTNDVAIQKYINVSGVYQGEAAISNGLKIGDKLIIEGHTEINNGSPLSIIDSQSPDQ